MKRIVNGLAYDTNKSTEIARSEYETDSGGMVYATLYQTAGRAFFEHRNICSKNDDGEEVNTNHFLPMSESEAHKWVNEGDVELVDELFIDPPEATAETAEASATIYLRAPASLKRRVDEAAAAAGLSINAYMLRCAEACLAGPKAAE